MALRWLLPIVTPDCESKENTEEEVTSVLMRLGEANSQFIPDETHLFPEAALDLTVCHL